MEDSEESEVFTVADCGQLERDVMTCKEFYEELLRSAERGMAKLHLIFFPTCSCCTCNTSPRGKHMARKAFKPKVNGSGNYAFSLNQDKADNILVLWEDTDVSLIL